MVHRNLNLSKNVCVVHGPRQSFNLKARCPFKWNQIKKQLAFLFLIWLTHFFHEIIMILDKQSAYRIKCTPLPNQNILPTQMQRSVCKKLAWRHSLLLFEDTSHSPWQPFCFIFANAHPECMGPQGTGKNIIQALLLMEFKTTKSMKNQRASFS